jgi:hypothetical protein
MSFFKMMASGKPLATFRISFYFYNYVELKLCKYNIFKSIIDLVI